MRFALVLNDKNKDNKDNKAKINKEKIFKEKILLPVLDIIKNNKDEISQEYILICLIQTVRILLTMKLIILRFLRK